MHFHVIRWSPVGLSTGERIDVADVDFASVATAAEADRVAALAGAAGARSATYECSDGCCTLHGPRPAPPLATTA